MASKAQRRRLALARRRAPLVALLELVRRLCLLDDHNAQASTRQPLRVDVEIGLREPTMGLLSLSHMAQCIALSFGNC